MLNIVVPMAGLGSRFQKAGYTTPKPLIPVNGVPMIQVVIKNLTPTQEHRFIFIVQQEQIEKYELDKKLKDFAPNSVIIPITYLTEGQASTALLAEDYIDNDDPIMCANCDQFIDFDINDYLKKMQVENLDGLIMTMKSNEDKWSYAKTNEEGLVVETAEKKVISEDATVGIFNFVKGSDFVKYTKMMIADNLRVNNEFYICPVYNYLVKENKRIGIYQIGKEFDGMYGLGTPKDLEIFLSLPISKKIG